MYPGREVYANSPLVLVAAEVRITYSPRLRRQDTLDAIAIALEDQLPVVRRMNSASIAVSDSGVEQHGDVQSVCKFLNRASTVAATISPTAITLETTDYVRFEQFADLYGQVCHTVSEMIGTAAVERVGLRFIDELRVPDLIGEARDWRGWVADPMVDMLDVASDRTALRSEAVTTYDLGQQRSLNFRFAALEGTGVVGNDPLRRRHVQQEPGNFFVIDIDGYWEGREQQSVDYDPTWIRDTLEGLHDPAGAAFQAAITERARKLFREEG